MLPALPPIGNCLALLRTRERAETHPAPKIALYRIQLTDNTIIDNLVPPVK
jgi:hypothetical protein